jgi:hypothetical protein
MLGFALLALVAPVVASAGSVYLNGENIDEVRNMKFDKCSVRIDENGNVFIEAAGYRVKRMEGAPAEPPRAAAPAPAPVAPHAVPAPPPAPVATAPMVAPAPPRITKRYWLVSHQTAPGLTEFDIHVYVNAKWVTTLRNDSQQDVMEITRLLTPGENSVTFEAKKVAQGARKSYSPDHSFTVVVGEGDAGGDNVMINRPLVNYKKTAADAESSSRDFSFTTR